MIDLKGRRVVVTGGKGFLGRHVVAELRKRSAHVLIPVHKSGYDLRNRSHVDQMYRTAQPDVVIHLAAVVGGIGANRENPGRFFYDNLKMGLELMDGAKEFGLRKFVQIGTVCAYPKFTPTPFKEEDLWNGYPEETNAPYGIAKKALLTMAQAYRAQYGLNSIYLIPVNLYGPHDNFKPESSHVIPALILKALEAKREGKPLIVWGTGSAYREFLHVRDAARGIVLATERYDGAEPINIGTGREVSVKDIVNSVCKATGFQGEVVWDASFPDGQPRRQLDVSKAKNLFDFEATIQLEEGIRETVAWFKETCEGPNSDFRL